MITKHKVRALPAPLDRFPAARKADAVPAHVPSTAHKDFGDLVTPAAHGQPQVLLHNTTPVAVPLPADSACDALSSDTAAYPGAAAAGEAVNSRGGQDRGSIARRLATLRDAIGSVLSRTGRRPHVRAARSGHCDGRSAAGSADARGGRPERRRKPAGSCRRTADRAPRPPPKPTWWPRNASSTSACTRSRVHPGGQGHPLPALRRPVQAADGSARPRRADLPGLVLHRPAVPRRGFPAIERRSPPRLAQPAEGRAGLG